MQHLKLTLGYDGTHFHGWQVQPGLPTIQGTLAAAIRHVVGEEVLPQGSGRTDAGVHALAQVASLSLRAPIPAVNLLRALNRALPPAIRVLKVEPVPESFHARHSAIRKTYEYRIFPRVRAPDRTRENDGEPDRICPPFTALAAWDCPWHIDLAAARCAASLIVGEHDFTSFAATDPELRSGERPGPRSAVRRIFCSTWHTQEDLLLYRVTGSGFLHHMVRNLVGTFVDAASGRTAPESIPQILAARNRGAAGQTAPACGLFLFSVEYPSESLPGNEENA